MLLKLFKQSYFAQIAFLFLFTLIIWLPAFIKPYPVIMSTSNLFTSFLFTPPFLNTNVLSVSLGFVVVLALAFFLSFIFSSHNLTHRNSFLAGFLFVLFLSRTPGHLGLNPALISLLFLLLALKKLLENFKSAQSYNLLFTASLLFSFASLFTPSVLLLFPIIWVNLIIFQSFNWRSIPISLVGLISPYFYIGIAYFMNDKSPLFFEQMKAILLSSIQIPDLPKTHDIIELVVAALLLFIASTYTLSRIGNQVISIRKKTTFMFWFLSLSILLSFINVDSSAREIVFIPFSAILGYYFSVVNRQFWANLFISLILIMILIQNYSILFYA
ncbi:MAG: hypothetical protein JW857_02635 [Bacteroidales bacterium]|nr:hypothetical protein [Bacteroidales bacterium]